MHNTSPLLDTQTINSCSYILKSLPRTLILVSSCEANKAELSTCHYLRLKGYDTGCSINESNFSCLHIPEIWHGASLYFSVFKFFPATPPAYVCSLHLKKHSPSPFSSPFQVSRGWVKVYATLVHLPDTYSHLKWWNGWRAFFKTSRTAISAFQVFKISYCKD